MVYHVPGPLLYPKTLSSNKTLPFPPKKNFYSGVVVFAVAAPGSGRAGGGHAAPTTSRRTLGSPSTPSRGRLSIACTRLLLYSNQSLKNLHITKCLQSV